MNQMQQDWNAFWQNTAPGTSQAFAGGTITRNPDGSATWGDGRAPMGLSFNQDTPFDVIAGRSQNIADLWNQQYGYQAPSTPTSGASFGAGMSSPAAAQPTQYQFRPNTQPTNAAQSSGGTQQNPYLTQMGDEITRLVNSNLERNVLPQIRGNFQSIGGFGGSRQGVVETNALNDANQSLAGAMANLYGSDWTNAQNRGLQQQQISNAYDLGLGNLGLGFGNLGLGQQNSMQNFYTAQRGQDLQAAGLGSQLVNSGNQNFINQGQGIYGIGNTYQQAPWGTIGGFNNAINPYTGLGTQIGNNNPSPASGFLGGALAGAQLFNAATGQPRQLPPASAYI